MANKYTKSFRIKVAREASDPANKGLEHVIAQKYGIMLGTVERWRDRYLEQGEQGLSKGVIGTKHKTSRERELEKEVADLREEVAILKKAAAFLANAKLD